MLTPHSSDPQRPSSARPAPWTLFVAAALLGLVCALPAPAAEHSPILDDVIATTPVGQTIPVILFLDGRLTMDDVYPVARTLPMPERRQYVVRTLKSRFADTGGRLMERLEGARKAGRVTLLRPLWIINAVRVSASADLIAEIDGYCREVLYIAYDGPRENTLDVMGWGVQEMEIPRVWSEFGADGSGVIVGHKDSGTDLTHSGYAGHFWINPGEDLNHNGAIDDGEANLVDDDGNGYVDDFYGWNFDDDNNDVSDRDASRHGSRTGSIISAGFSPCDTVAVAPGAKLMELSGYNYQGAVFESSQYAVEMGAHVISASLSFKQSECESYNDCPNYVAHRMVSEMELAAGLLHANSTGNDGLANPVPLSVPAPANSPPPAMLPGHPQQGGVSSIIAVAAYFSTGAIQTTSGRGPSGWSREDICVHPRMPFCAPDGYGNQFPPEYGDYPYHNAAFPGLLKPDITAPTGARSLAWGGGCSTISGTSGATPHVGGACALIYSAFPGITPESAYRLLMTAALDSGIVGPDTLWGFGRLRPYPACSTATAQWTRLSGTVTHNSQPVVGVRVTSDTLLPVFTDATGHYEIFLASGTHHLFFKKYPYADASIEVVASGGTLVRDLSMGTANPASVMFAVQPPVPMSARVPIFLPDIPLADSTDDAGSLVVQMTAGRFAVIYGCLPWTVDTLALDIMPGNTEIWLPLHLSPRALPTGPDAHGYYIYDNFDAPVAAFNWIEINPNLGGLPGQMLAVGNDNTVAVNLPFTFSFYGTSYTRMAVSANGYILMGNTSSTEWLEYPIPSSRVPNGFLAPFWDDWEPSLQGGVYFYSQVDSHRVIVEWSGLLHYDQVGPVTFEAILYDPQFVTSPTGDGVAKFQYGEMNGRHEGLVGIESPSGTDGIEYRFQLQYDSHGSPIEFGRALYVTTDSTLDADEPVHPSLPREFSLAQNYPNPFNPVTTFRWFAPRASRVRLVLYDILGREAAVIFDGVCTAGENHVPFAASSLSSGVYFARLDAGGQPVSSRKVLLLK